MDLTYYKKPMDYMKANPDCTLEQFQQATGCTKQSWYDSRYKARQLGTTVKDYSRAMSKTKFFATNPTATYEEFAAAFKDATRLKFAQGRYAAKKYLERRNVDGKIVESLITRKRKTKKKEKPVEQPKQVEFKQATPKVEKPQKPTDQERLNKMYEGFGIDTSESTSLGITPDFIWYESTIIRNDFARTMSRFEHLVRVMEARQADNNKALERMLSDYRKLREENKSLTAILDAKTKPGV